MIDIVFGYPACDFTAEETVQAKMAYESFMATHGHKVRSYRANNGRFADKIFGDSVIDGNQKLSFCGVSAHHQNGIAEEKIKTTSLAC